MDADRGLKKGTTKTTRNDSARKQIGVKLSEINCKVDRVLGQGFNQAA